MILGYKNHRDFLKAYGFILGVSTIALVVRLAKFWDAGVGLNIILFIIFFFIAAFSWELLRVINRYLNKIMPFENGIPKRVTVQLILGAVIGLTMRFLIYHFGEPYLPVKLDNLFLATTWFLYMSFPTAINLGFFTTYFIGRWKDTLVNAEKLEREKTQVQFDNLKNQLNPHFLFNALTSLNSLIFEDQALASRFLQQLSKVYRYVLQHKDKTVVSLETELIFIGHYVSLLNTRFKNSLDIKIDIADTYKEMGIVPVTLQILIENALKHNVVDGAKPLYISVTTRGEYLLVSNTLKIKRTVEESNKQGLDNLKNLYKYLTDVPVVVEEGPEYFIAKIPLLHI